MDNERKKQLQQELENLLRVRFGGLDFWRLNKKWKQIRYEQVTKELLFIIEAEIERK